MDHAAQGREIRKLGGAPDYGAGSVHAVTEDGQVLIASNSGSQLGPYASGAGKLIWVVGAQKIVKDLNKGFSVSMNMICHSKWNICGSSRMRQ